MKFCIRSMPWISKAFRCSSVTPSGFLMKTTLTGLNEYCERPDDSAGSKLTMCRYTLMSDRIFKSIQGTALTFAAFVIHSQVPGYPASNVASLGNISIPESKILHQLIKNTSDIASPKVPVQWRPRRKSVTRQRWHNQMIRQSLRGILLSELLQYW